MQNPFPEPPRGMPAERSSNVDRCPLHTSSVHIVRHNDPTLDSCILHSTRHREGNRCMTFQKRDSECWDPREVCTTKALIPRTCKLGPKDEGRGIRTMPAACHTSFRGRAGDAETSLVHG